MKVNSTEKRIRPSLPVDIARLRQTENVFSKDSTYYKNDKKQVLLLFKLLLDIIVYLDTLKCQ